MRIVIACNAKRRPLLFTRRAIAFHTMVTLFTIYISYVCRTLFYLYSDSCMATQFFFVYDDIAQSAYQHPVSLTFRTWAYAYSTIFAWFKLKFLNNFNFDIKWSVDCYFHSKIVLVRFLSLSLIKPTRRLSKSISVSFNFTSDTGVRPQTTGSQRRMHCAYAWVRT